LHEVPVVVIYSPEPLFIMAFYLKEFGSFIFDNFIELIKTVDGVLAKFASGFPYE